MRHTYHILSALMAFCLAACSSDGLYDFFVSKSYIEVDESVTIAGDKGAESSFSIKADCSWTIENIPSWLSVEPSSGNGNATVKLICTESNPNSTQKREAKLRISAANGSIVPEITVTQSHSTGGIVFVDEIEFDCMQESRMFSLVCNSNWEISAPEKWITVTPTKGEGNAEIEVTVVDNRSNARNTQITITATDIAPKVVEVRQKAYEKSLSVSSANFAEGKKNTLVFPRKGGEKNFILRSSDAWEISKAYSWIEISPMSKGTGGVSQVLVTVPKNEGNARSMDNLLITNTVGCEEYITIEQEAAVHYLQLQDEKDEVNFDAEGRTNYVTVSCNEQPKVIVPEGSWIKEAKVSGGTSNIYTIALTAQPNTGTARGPITITITNSANDMVTIKASQAATNLQISPTEISMPCTASSASIIVTSNGDWEAISNQSWCKVEKRGGEVSVSVADNTSSSPRTAVVTVRLSSGSDSRDCTVTQEAAKVANLSALSATDITKYSFTVKGSYTSDFEVKEYGVCVSESISEPSLADTAQSCTGSQKEGSFSFNVTGLQSAKTYYVRAYAKTAVGTSYSAAIQVTTSGAIPNQGDNNPPVLNIKHNK